MGGRVVACPLDIPNHTRKSIGETHFSMTYGVETVIPLKTGFPILRTSSFNSSDKNRLLEKSLDFIEEMRENAMV